MHRAMMFSDDCHWPGCANLRVRGTLYCPLHRVDDLEEAAPTGVTVETLSMEAWLARSCTHGMLLGHCHLSLLAEFPGTGYTPWEARDVAASPGVYFN